MSETATVYQAEFTLRDMLELSTVHVHGRQIDVPPERRFTDIEAVQRYVDKVLALNWVRAKYPRAAYPITVKKKPSKTANEAACGGGLMYVPINSHVRWALREIVILHEIAHHLAGAGADHRQEFRDCFAWLLEEIIAPEVGWLMRTIFWDRGLTCVQPTNSVVR